jgi:CubicO group peptidase (beta-lactamase class C family)
MDSVDEAFDPLLAELDNRALSHPGESVRLAAYLDGREVMNVRRGPAPADALQVSRSASIGVLTVLAAVLHKQGRVDLDAPVSHWWPAFSAAGKSQVTGRVLLSHQAGLPVLDEPLPVVQPPPCAVP